MKEEMRFAIAKPLTLTLIATTVVAACSGIGDEQQLSSDNAAPINVATVEQAALTPVPGCVDGEFDGHDYRYCPAFVPWISARDACRSWGLDLVSIESQAENNYVSLLGNFFLPRWIGANDRTQEDLWTWSDGDVPFWSGTSIFGTPINGAYEAFPPWETVPDGGALDCANIRPFTGGIWMTTHCLEFSTFVCESVDECPDNPDKLEPGVCGCDVLDTDSDGDEVPDCIDVCKDDPTKVYPHPCPCGADSDDDDGDLIPNCQDPCPSSPGGAGTCCIGPDPAPANTVCHNALCPGSSTCGGDATCGDDSCKPDPSCTAVRHPDPNICAIYWVCDGATTWDSASTKCQAGDLRWLADVGGPSENTEILKLVRAANITEPVWLGGNQFELGGWTWQNATSNDGQPFWDGDSTGAPFGREFANWTDTAPSSTSGEDCVVMLPDGTWEDRPCGESHAYVCRAFDHLCLDGGGGREFEVPRAPVDPPVYDPEPANCVDDADLVGVDFPQGPGSPTPCGEACPAPCADGSCESQIESLEDQLINNQTLGGVGTTSCGIGGDENFVGDLDQCGYARDVPFLSNTPCFSHADCGGLTVNTSMMTPERQSQYAQILNPIGICVPVAGEECVSANNCQTQTVGDQVLPERRCRLAEFDFVEAHTLTDSNGSFTTPAHAKTSCLPDPIDVTGAQDPTAGEQCRFVDLCDAPFAGTTDSVAPTGGPATVVNRTDPPSLGDADIRQEKVSDYEEDFCALPFDDDSECDCTATVNDVGPIGDNNQGTPSNSSGGLLSLEFDPGIEYNLDVNPKPFGQFDLDASARGSLDVSASLFTAPVGLLNAEVVAAIDECSARFTRNLSILAPPLEGLEIGEYFLDEVLGLPDDFDTDPPTLPPDPDGPPPNSAPQVLKDASAACRSAQSTFNLALSRMNKAYRDAQSLLELYREGVESGVKFERETFCDQVAQLGGRLSPPEVIDGLGADYCAVEDPDNPGQTIPPGGNLADNPLPEDVINRFVEYYQEKITDFNAARDAVRAAAAQLVSAVAPGGGDEGLLSFQGSIPIGDPVNDTFGDTVVEFPFAIGPIPMVFSLDVFATYGIGAPAVEYHLDPLAAANVFVSNELGAACPLLAADPSVCDQIPQSAEIAGVSLAGLSPGIGAGATLFLGAGFSINGFSITLGVTGDLTLIEVGVPVEAGATLNMSVSPDEREIDERSAVLAVGDDPIASLAFPRTDVNFSMGWKIGGYLDVDNILAGTVSARLRLRLNLLFVTLNFEFKQRMFDFPPLADPDPVPLFNNAGEIGADISAIVPALDTEDLGFIQNKVAYLRLAKVPVPTPTTSIGDIAGSLGIDLPGGVDPTTLYEDLALFDSSNDFADYVGLVYEGRCESGPD